MNAMINSSNQSLNTTTCASGLHVIVVDDDIICLSIVAGILRKWKYQVVTVKNAEDALNTLRRRNGVFHLVVTDVHMPEMDGYEFQKQVQEEFQLPVVMMSADDRESSMLKGLEAGAAFYIVKPVKYDDLKNLWQYTVGSRNGKSVVIQEIENAQGAPLLEKTNENVDRDTTSSGDEERHNKRGSKKKAQKRVNEGNEKDSDAIAPKKAKVVWSTALHNRFLEAVRKIGLDRAVPKRILEHMSVPGLTRENIASHLQKYRIFLRRLSEASDSDGSGATKRIQERALRSSFATGHPALLFNVLQQGFPLFLNQQQPGSSSQPGFIGNIQIANDPGFSALILPNNQASNTNPIPDLGNGGSQQKNNQRRSRQPTSTNANALNESDDGVMNSTRQQQAQEPSEPVPNAVSNNFTASGSPEPNNVLGIENTGSFDTSNLVPNFNNSNNIVDSSQMGAGGDFGDRRLMTKKNANLTLGPERNMDSGYCAQGASSSQGFGITDHLPPSSSNVVRQENNPTLLPELDNLGNGEEDDCYSLDQLMNNTASGENFPFAQFSESDLDDIFLNHLTSAPENEQHIGEDVQNHGYNIINSNPVEQNPPENFNQRENDGGIMDNNLGNDMNHLDDYFPSFDSSYPQQQYGGGEFQVPGPYNHYLNVDPTWNQDASDDFMDPMFGPGMN